MGSAACKVEGGNGKRTDGGQGLLLQEGSAVCPGGYSNKVKASGPVRMRGSATGAEHGEDVSLQLFQGRLSTAGFRSEANFPIKREIPILPTARGSLSVSLFKGNTVFAYHAHMTFRDPAPPRSSHSPQHYRYQTENEN